MDDYVGLLEDRRRETARRATKAHKNRGAGLQPRRIGSPADVGSLNPLPLAV